MNGWRELRRLPRRVWVLSVCALVNRMGTMALPFLTLYLTRALGWPAPRAASIVAIYGAVSFLIPPVAGRLCDRWGTRPMMLAALGVSGAAMLAMPLMASYAAVALTTVIWAVFNEAFRPANMTAVTESAPAEQRKQAYALHRAAINLGMSVGPAVGGVLAASSFKSIWLADGLTTLASAATLALYLEHVPPIPKAGGSAAPSTAGLRDARLLLCLLGCVLISVVFFQHEAALPLYLVRDLHYSEKFFGLLFTVNTLLIVAVEIPLNHAAAHWTHRTTMTLGAALFAVGYAAYGVTPAAWGLIAATVIWSFGEMILFPGMSAYIAAIAPKDRLGEYMGLYITSFGTGFMIAPLAGVTVLEHLGPAALWGGCLVVGLLSTAVFSTIKARAEA